MPISLPLKMSLSWKRKYGHSYKCLFPRNYAFIRRLRFRFNKDDLLSLTKWLQLVKVIVFDPSGREQRPLRQSYSLTVHMSFLQTGISLEFVYHDYTWISSSLSYWGIKRDDVDLSFITALSTSPPADPLITWLQILLLCCLLTFSEWPYWCFSGIYIYIYIR